MQTATRELVRMSWDSGDPYGSAMSAWFGIASALHVRGETIPAGWEFRPSPMLHTVDDLEDYPDLEIWEVLEAGEASADDMRRAGDVLTRYVRLLEHCGRTY